MTFEAQDIINDIIGKLQKVLADDAEDHEAMEEASAVLSSGLEDVDGLRLAKD